MPKGKKEKRLLHSLVICAVFLVASVGTSYAAPVITATLKAYPESYSGACPATIKFDGEIAIKGITKPPVTLNYIFTRSDGATDTNVKTLTFETDGAKKVSTTWTLGGDKLPTYSGWQAIKVLTRPAVESNKAKFEIKCQAGLLTPMPQLRELKLEEISIMKEPVKKIPAKMAVKIPLNVALVKADLTCNVRAYHDQQRTRPIQANVWHMNPALYSPPLPYPWYIYYDIEVRNVGTAKADNFTVKVTFVNPNKPPQIFNETVSLDPGEAAVLPYYWGYFLPSMTPSLVNRMVVISSFVDATSKIDEGSNEGNNQCNYAVRFVYP